MGKCKKQELLLIDDSSSIGGTRKWNKPVHVMNHKIVISNVFTRSRWSDLNASDLLSLNSEMLNDVCSRRFCLCPLESSDDSGNFHGISSSNEEENSFTALNPAKKRCLHEIANVPRFAQMGVLTARLCCSSLSSISVFPLFFGLFVNCTCLCKVIFFNGVVKERILP